MGAMLGIDDRGRWQLRNLMTPRPVTRNLLLISELATAIPALVGVMVNDLVHPILSQQLATRARVTRLTARLALLRILASQLLCFLARLRTALLARLRSVRRRWLTTVTRTR
jgi:uncharacterized protein VirK/YbjX